MQVPTGVPVPVVPRSNAKVWMIPLALLLLCGTVAFAFQRSGGLGVFTPKSPSALQAKGSDGESTLRAKGEPRGNTLQVPGPEGASTLQADGPQAVTTLQAGPMPEHAVLKVDRAPESPQMPEDVRTYLEHIARIERRRKGLSQNQLAALSGRLAGMQAHDLSNLISTATEDEENPAQTEASKFGHELDDLRAEWKLLDIDFLAVEPPQECRSLANDYGYTLSETKGMMTDLLEILDGAMANPEGAIATLTKMQGTSGEIDRAGKQSDTEVARICEKYATRKWFSIASDFGSGIFGGLMGGTLPKIPDLGGTGPIDQ